MESEQDGVCQRQVAAVSLLAMAMAAFPAGANKIELVESRSETTMVEIEVIGIRSKIELVGSKSEIELVDSRIKLVESRSRIELVERKSRIELVENKPELYPLALEEWTLSIFVTDH